MATCAATYRVDRTPEEVFDAIGTRLFELAFDLRPGGSSATDPTVHVKMEPRGFLRLMSPLIALQLPGRTARITRSMVDMIEVEPDRDAVA